MSKLEVTIAPVYIASVRVMKSFDYSHFEVALSSTEPMDLAGVDAMRKEAARLADKAVEQYKIAKAAESTRLSRKNDFDYAKRMAEEIRTIPELQRTVAQQAKLKAYDDMAWVESRRYDYEDDWDDGND